MKISSIKGGITKRGDELKRGDRTPSELCFFEVSLAFDLPAYIFYHDLSLQIVRLLFVNIWCTISPSVQIVCHSRNVPLCVTGTRSRAVGVEFCKMIF